MKKLRIRRPTALLTLTLLALSSFAALAFAVPAAAETTISITTTNGYQVCPAYPLYGTWLGDTCTILSVLFIEPGTTLSIGTGVTLAVTTSDDAVDNSGVINNAGILTGTAAAGGPESIGTGLVNFGTVTSNGTMSFTGDPYSVLNDGTIINNGTMSSSNSYGGYYPNIWNLGTIQNSGTIDVIDTNPLSTAGIYNDGAITNEGTVSASDSNTGGYGISNQATITNDGNMTASNTIGNAGTITNDGTMSGIIKPNVAPGIGAGYINNESAVINNYGTMTGAGISSPGIYNDGVINNHATMNGTGTINTPFPADGIDNSGVINNYGNTTANGAAYGLNNINTTNEYCGATLTYSSLSGNAPVDACLGQVQALEGTVNGMGFPPGTTTSLDSKLSAAMNSLSSGSDVTAANQLSAFVHEVNAQSGKQIPAADAQQLVSLAQAILTQLEPS